MVPVPIRAGLEIKIVQCGRVSGQLPGHKVTDLIARLRHGLESPSFHRAP